MKSKLATLAASALLTTMLAGCASAPEPGAVIVDENDPERIICKNDAPTGSRLPKKTCKTAREWDALAEENQLAKRNLRRSSNPGSISQTNGQ